MLDVIDWSNFAFDLEGLKNYMQFGYCVFEHTPIKNVKFLRYYSILTQNIDENGKKSIKIENLEDPCLQYIGKKSTVDDVMSTITNHMADFEKTRDKSKRILLPLSGGNDSRFLASLIKDKSSIDAYTYGLTKTGDCWETARAKEVAKRLGINHQVIKLRDFNGPQYCQKAFDVYGLQMPLHAMYHMEFYDNIIKQFSGNYVVVSGSVGDWFAGEKIPLNTPKDPDDFSKIFFNHGISIPSEFIKTTDSNAICEEYFEQHSSAMKSNKTWVRVAMFRNRINLAGYIFTTAKTYLESYTPYYDIDIAWSQLNLSDEDGKDRKWQADYFKSIGLDVENDVNVNATIKSLNRLDSLVVQSSFDIKSQLLNVEKLKQFVVEERLNWINEQLIWLKNTNLISIEDFLHNINFNNPFTPNKIANLANRLRGKAISLAFGNKMHNAIKAFNEWTVLKPIEMMIDLANRKNL